MERRNSQQRGLGVVVACAAAVTLCAPASAGAATTIGQVNPSTPNGGGNCDPQEVYTQSRSAGVVLDTAPSAGVITSWATNATDTPGQQAQLKTISSTPNPGAVFTVQASSALQALTPSTLNRFATRIPIQAGQRIGYFFPAGADDSQSCTYNGVQNPNEVAAGPSNGQPGSSFTDVDGSSQKLLNLEATIEGDADRDGFGDETQDRCPGAAGTNGGCSSSGGGAGGSDKTKPSLGSFSFSATTFKAATSGSAFSTRKKKYPTGTKVSFNLSEASSVRFTVQRKTKGRKVGSKCKTKTDANRRKKKCTLWKAVSGSFTVPGKAGKNTFTFRGRIGGKALSSGRYRLSATATDPSKNASLPKRKGFRIVR
jgi:hypothetical protein